MRLHQVNLRLSLFTYNRGASAPGYPLVGFNFRWTFLVSLSFLPVSRDNLALFWKFLVFLNHNASA